MNNLTPHDATRLEKLGFSREPKYRSEFVSSPSGWSFLIGANIDWPLLGTLLGMLRGKFNICLYTSHSVAGQPAAYRVGRTIHICIDATPRDIFEVCMEALENG